MDSRAFTTLSEQCNRRWLGRTVGLPSNGTTDIDLCDESFGMEMKSRLREWYHSFPVHAYQIDLFRELHPSQELFWAFLMYGLNREISDVSVGNIGGSIKNREVWFLEWDWIRQFPISYPKTGPYVYVNTNYFPNADFFRDVRVNKAMLHIPKNSSLDSRIPL